MTRRDIPRQWDVRAGIPIVYEVKGSGYYTKDWQDFSYFGTKDDKERVKELEKSLEAGFIYDDNPDVDPSEDTHFLEDYSYNDEVPELRIITKNRPKGANEYIYSKRITDSKRFNYGIRKPVVMKDEEGNFYYKITIYKYNCYGHRVKDKEYSEVVE